MRTESYNEFKTWWESQPDGTKVYRVRTFDGNTGNKVGVEFSTEVDDIEDMQTVSGGYYTETATLTRNRAKAQANLQNPVS